MSKARKKTTAGSAPQRDDELLTLDQALAMLKTSRPTLYRWLRTGEVKGMKVGRQWRFRRQDLERFMQGQSPRVDLPADIQPLLDHLRTRLQGLSANQPSPTWADTPVRQAIAMMILLADGMRASDIHVHPLQSHDNDQAAIRFRIDGVLHLIASYDLRLHASIIEQWKRMAACNVQCTDVSQDGRIMLDVRGERMDLRVCFVPAMFGEALTARLLKRSEANLQIDQLQYTPANNQRLRRWINAPNGIVLITGPTGSGKTTALYACLNEIDHEKHKVMTIEDPVEYVLPGLVQSPVKTGSGFDFARALRSFLRSDPDVIMVGETRNNEVMQICIQAALTGHLVFTTLHTNDAASALHRMRDIGADAFLIADSVRLIVAQRLVRKLCTHCSIEDKPSNNRMEEVVALAREGGLDLSALRPNWRKAAGCDKCAQLGYRGRTTVVEMMEMTGPLGAALRRGASTLELRQIAVREGMTTMLGDGIRRAADGQTSLDEVFRVASG